MSAPAFQPVIVASLSSQIGYASPPMIPNLMGRLCCAPAASGVTQANVAMKMAATIWRVIR
jgi:hypothetical protein